MSVTFTISILAIIALQLYPKSIYFDTKSDLAVIVKAKQQLKTEPITKAANDTEETDIVYVPEGSLCKVIATRASWHYVELPSQTRGWLKKNAITKILKPNPDLAESVQP